jgi:chromosome segregation ATPase
MVCDQEEVKMSEESTATENNGADAPTVEQLQAQLAEITQSFESVKAKNEELLTETKAAKAKRREAEDAATAERERIAREKGDHEQLYKSAQEKLNATLEELTGLKGSIANEKRNSAALQIAAELADGANAKLLSEFVSRRLKFTEEGLKVTNDRGELTISTLADLKTEFKNDPTYAALLKGNQSSGGGATGGSNGGGAAKVLNRADFEALNPTAKMSFMKGGGKIDNQ